MGRKAEHEVAPIGDQLGARAGQAETLDEHRDLRRDVFYLGHPSSIARRSTATTTTRILSAMASGPTVILGGTGFISGAIVRVALARGHAVHLVHRGSRPSPAGTTESIVDRADTPRLEQTLSALRPAAVIDTCAMTAAHAESLVTAMRQLDARLTVLSSQDVYAQFGRLNGLPAPEPEPMISEGSPLTVPFPFRGIADHAGGPDYDKKDVERIVARRTDRGVVILRLPAVTGAGDPKRRFGAVVDAIDGGALTMVHDGGALRWSHTDVDDVALACVLAAEHERRSLSIFNVGEANVPTMRERFDALATAMGVVLDWRTADEEAPCTDSLLGSFPNDVIADDGAIREALGWSERGTFAELAPGLIEALRRSRT